MQNKSIRYYIMSSVGPKNSTPIHHNIPKAQQQQHSLYTIPLQYHDSTDSTNGSIYHATLHTLPEQATITATYTPTTTTLTTNNHTPSTTNSPTARNPCGTSCNLSPWLIHTSNSCGKPSSNGEVAVVVDVVVTTALPYSRFSQGATLPPKTCANS